MTDPALVRTTSGTVRGCVEDGLHVFRGVPGADYARTVTDAAALVSSDLG
jgi:carboxylesterase type B